MIGWSAAKFHVNRLRIKLTMRRGSKIYDYSKQGILIAFWQFATANFDNQFIIVQTAVLTFQRRTVYEFKHYILKHIEK